MATEIWVNIGSGNGLLPDATKPLPKPMLTNHLWSPVSFILGQFHKRCLNHQSLKSVWKIHLKFHSNFPGANELSKITCCLTLCGTQTWSSLCLQMSQPIEVTGHQQAKCWLKFLLSFCNYHQISNIRRTKSQNLNFSRLAVVSIYWSHVLGRQWRCSWSSTGRWCSNYIWVFRNFIA